ncbi:MAG: ABC transporter permease [Nibricoccus sp.]
MLSDLRFALRSLAKTPGFTAVAILIVAIGIGATTAMFSAVNALVLLPVPLPASDRLAVVYETNLPRKVSRFAASYRDYCDWRDQSHSWESLGTVTWRAMNLTGGTEPKFVHVHAMTANLLPTLGIPPFLGRGFLDEEDRPGHNQVAILSHGFWQRHFGGRPDIIGQSFNLDGASYTVVGVMPAKAFFPGDLEIAIPLGAAPRADRRYDHDFDVYGRLKPGVSLQQANAELKTIMTQLYAGFPEADRSWSIETIPLSSEVVGSGLRTNLFVLLGAVILLLLIACANLSNLLLVRASNRAHEIAIRTALGATRWQIVRQLIVESLTLTAAGGLLGVFLARWAVNLLQSANLPRATEISIDARVLVATCGTTLIAGCLAGIGPALKASLTRPQAALKGRGPRSGHGSRLRDTMVVSQLALSLSLLIGASMLVLSFWRLIKVNPGFATEGVVSVAVRPRDRANAVAFYEQVTARVAALPDVAGVGLVSSLPLGEGNTSNPVFPVGPTLLATGQSIQSNWRLVDGGYFDAMQIPLLRGRSFAGLSPEQARQSVVLSASLARALFGDEDPVGRHIETPRSGTNQLTVIGVVGDVRSKSLGTEPPPTFYWSMHRFIYGPMAMVVRSSKSTEPLIPTIRSIVKNVDSSVPVFWIRTMNEVRAESVDRERFVTALLGGFAITSLVLATLGIYGVVAFTVQQRTREFGIRVAIGAQAGDILRLVVGQGLRLVALGTIIGIAMALLGSRLLAAMLYETGTHDLLSYAVATAVLASAAAIAAFLPAHRATKVNPIEALRAE